MSGALDRLVGTFLAPAGAPAPAPPPPPPPRPSIAVLGGAAEAVAVGSAVALADGAPVVAVWGAAARPGPSTPGAKRLATRLAERGHAAAPCGRLVRVALDRPEEAARVDAVAPAVLVVAGPRDEQVDDVLAGYDRVVVAGDNLVAELAAQSVAALGVPTATLAPPDAPIARLLAAQGLALVAPWRAAFR